MLVLAASSSSTVRPPSFLLHHDRPCPDLATADEVADADLYYVTPAPLAVDGKIEQRPIAEPTLVTEPEADSPDLLRL
jgi:hypothetical protein